MSKFLQHSSETEVSCRHRFVAKRIAEKIVAREERLNAQQQTNLESWAKVTQPAIPARKFQMFRVPGSK